MTGDPLAWLGEHEIPIGNARRFEVGPLRARIEHFDGEWALHWCRGEDPLDGRLTIEAAGPVERFDYADRAVFPVALGDILTLGARTPDRPIVTRPRIPIVIPAGQHTLLYVFSPVWLTASVGDAEFGEMPSWRPTDTWFGPNRMDGEIWYANRTPVYLHPEQVPPSPARILTRATVRNDTPAAVQLDRIALPLPRMSLFRATDGRLWTEDVDVHCRARGEVPATSIEPGGPDDATEPSTLSAPRQPRDGGGLLGRFTALWDHERETGWTGPA